MTNAIDEKCHMNSPPPVLSMARVLAYAVVDRSVNFSGHQRLYVDGKLLGKVPRLALCRPLGAKLADTILILYCDIRWDVLGIANADSLEAAKSEAERCYPGISQKWIEKQVTESEAKEWLKVHCHEAICSFCGRFPFEMETYVSHGPVVICNVCIDGFYTTIHHRSQQA